MAARAENNTLPVMGSINVMAMKALSFARSATADTGSSPAADRATLMARFDGRRPRPMFRGAVAVLAHGLLTVTVVSLHIEVTFYKV